MSLYQGSSLCCCGRLACLQSLHRCCPPGLSILASVVKEAAPPSWVWPPSCPCLQCQQQRMLAVSAGLLTSFFNDVSCMCRRTTAIAGALFSCIPAGDQNAVCPTGLQMELRRCCCCCELLCRASWDQHVMASCPEAAVPV